jgi:hypothetical protein
MSIDKELRLHNITLTATLIVAKIQFRPKVNSEIRRHFETLPAFTTLDNQRNSDIRENLQVKNMVQKISR